MKVEDFIVHALSLLLVIFEYGLVAGNEGDKLSKIFKLCSRKDPQLNSCLKSAIDQAVTDLQHGSSDLKLLPLDPLVVTNINIEEGAGRPVKMSLDLNNANLYGLSKIALKEVRADLDNRYLEIDVKVPYTRIFADYVMDGRFLVLPLKGSGKCSMNLTDYTAIVKITSRPIIKHGETHWDVTEFNLRVITMERFQVNFDNLFNGDKELGDNTNRVLNENWKEFFEELRPTLHDTFGTVFQKVANSIFHKIPENKIFLA